MRLLLCLLPILFFTNYAIALPIFDPISAITNCDMTTASCTSSAIDIGRTTEFSAMATFTGNPVGTIKMQISDDIVNSGSLVTNWVDYSTTIQSITTNGNFGWNLSGVNYRWLRFVYTKTSCTAPPCTLNVVFGKKM
jgi:hypothetical protein